MYRNVLMAAMLLHASMTALGDVPDGKVISAGAFSVGTRNTISLFSDDNAVGKGIGGQFRYLFSDRFNTEFFSDFISSQTNFSHREDYHIGWSLMYYFGHTHFDHFLQPYLLAGHC